MASIQEITNTINSAYHTYMAELVLAGSSWETQPAAGGAGEDAWCAKQVAEHVCGAAGFFAGGLVKAIGGQPAGGAPAGSACSTSREPDISRSLRLFHQTTPPAPSAMRSKMYSPGRRDFPWSVKTAAGRFIVAFAVCTYSCPEACENS